MRKLTFAIFMTFVIGFGVFSNSFALKPSSPTFIPTVTRYVKLFGELENKLNAAIASGDSTTVDKLLTFNFEQIKGQEPNKPIPKVEWIPASITKKSKPVVITNLSARELGDVVIVSFKEKSKQNSFIVDVWNKQNEDWKLRARYVS